MKRNSILKTVTSDIPIPTLRCSPLIKYSSETNKSFDKSVGISIKESSRIKGSYIAQFVKQTIVTIQYRRT